MKMFRKKRSETTFFEEEPLDARFDAMMAWVKYLTRKDFNKIKKAMDQDYSAYQILHGIEPEDGGADDNAGFMLTDEEGK